MSNAYANEILSAVSARIGAERLLAAHDWTHRRLVEIGADALGADAMNIVGSPAERRWFGGEGTILDSIRRLMDGSAESTFAIQRPARWLVRLLFWALVEPSLGQEWLDEELLTYEPLDYPLLVRTLFDGDSASLAILSEHLGATDQIRDRMPLLAGALWSLSALTVLVPVLRASMDHPERLAEQAAPRNLAVALFADLADEFFPADHPWPKIRALAHKRQARARDEQGTEE